MHQLDPKRFFIRACLLVEIMVHRQKNINKKSVHNKTQNLRSESKTIQYTVLMQSVLI